MKYFLVLLSVSVMTLQPGCSGGSGDTPEIGDVSGTIKVDGTPKAKLQVAFQPEEGRPSTGKTDDDGYYTLKYSLEEEGAKVGKGVIRITSPVPEDADGCGGGCGEEEFVEPIPPKYNSDAANNPEMNVEVKPGSNTFDFEVDTSGGGNPRPSNSCGDDTPSCCCS